MKKNKKSYHTKKNKLKLIVVNPLDKEQEKRMVQAISEMLKIKYYS